jgi:hypothetical protein
MQQPVSIQAAPRPLSLENRLLRILSKFAQAMCRNLPDKLQSSFLKPEKALIWNRLSGLCGLKLTRRQR